MNNQSTLGAMLKSMLDQPKPVRIERVKPVNMPAAVHELTRDFAGTMHIPHDTLMNLLWEKLGADLNAAMECVVASRTAARECMEAEERYAQAQEHSHFMHDVARGRVDALCGDLIPLVL